MQYRSRFMTALGSLALLSACAEHSAPIAGTVGGDVFESRQGATTVGATVKSATGFSEERTDYDWTIEKRVKAIMGGDMVAEPSVTETRIAPNQVKWIAYEFVVNRSVKSDSRADGARGEVCVTNRGSSATNSLAITDVIQAKVGSGAYTDVASRPVDLSAKPVLVAGETHCYPYETTFAPVSGASYQNVARVTLANGSLSEAAGTAFQLPASPTAVTKDATALLQEGMNQTCANIFPSLICEGAERFHDMTLDHSQTFEGPHTVDLFNFKVCGEDYPFPNTVKLVEGGPYPPGVAPEVHYASATVTIHTGDCAPKPTNPGCTYTQGYWKNHPWPQHPIWTSTTLATWPDIANWKFFDTGVEWPDVLGTPPRGNAYYILANQYIAAVLNQQNGAYVPPLVRDVLLRAYEYFASSPAVRATYDRNTLTTWASLLDQYNNGRLGVPHCG